jgi:hypothetical protein
MDQASSSIDYVTHQYCSNQMTDPGIEALIGTWDYVSDHAVHVH